MERKYWYFPGPWVGDGQRSTFDLKAIQSFGDGGGEGRGSSLDDLPAVSDSTTEHHTEDHPNDLLRGKQSFNKKKTKKPQTFSLTIKRMHLLVFSSSESLTHHDSSDADAHVPDDVEFAVEEVLDACLTVLRDKDSYTIH